MRHLLLPASEATRVWESSRLSTLYLKDVL